MLSQVFCFCVVIYEVVSGTQKFFSAPVANVVFSTEIEMPMVTICHTPHELKMGPLPGNLTYRDIVDGNFYPNETSSTFDNIDDIIQKAMKEHNYLLNLTEKKEDCQVRQRPDKDYERIYVGTENMTEDGQPCMNWSEVTEEDYSEYEETRGHNYCRNPGVKEDREFCYINQTHTGFCAVKTCGNL